MEGHTASIAVLLPSHSVDANAVYVGRYGVRGTAIQHAVHDRHGGRNDGQPPLTWVELKGPCVVSC